jgi:putative ABC transport system substrate-binding protein
MPGSTRTTAIYVAFLLRMAELGYEEGKNFVFEYVQVPNIEGYERGYQELAGHKIDVWLASGPEIGLKSALAAAGTQPVVMVAIELARGYVTSLVIVRQAFAKSWPRSY